MSPTHETAAGPATEGAADSPAPGQARPALPDRLSTDARSPHYVEAVFEHPIGIRFNGLERHDVEEYCVSEGWIKVPAGKTRDRRGNPLLITLKGRVEPYYRETVQE
jgi:hypothetical protein